MGKREIRVIVSGGGTGGHLFPGIAVAEAIIERYPGSKVLFVGTGRPTDERVLAGKKFAKTSIRCMGLKGKSLLEKVAAMAQLPLATFAAMRLMRSFRPQIVLGVGGYVTGPVLLAARVLRIPTCIHEQNSVPGMANRKLGKMVDRVFLSIPGSERYFAPGKCVLTGNPLRGGLVAAASWARPEKKKTTLLVLGGSLGAHRVNTLMIEAVSILLKNKTAAEIDLVHQTGPADEKMVGDSYRELGITADVAPFFDDMAKLYTRADLVVSRAGATSLAEMTLFGLPMILIPYPFAADDHQRKNGEYLVQGGAAQLFGQDELTGEKLAGAIGELICNKEKRKRMSRAAKEFARPDATGMIVEQCVGLIK
ncbi:MAG: undecaprenyldiphospho-muramoylpentapeptide beta-N-acetylglucosaminyltransferase [Pseudomonadota bacterium]